jgi:hypothetical protein
MVGLDRTHDGNVVAAPAFGLFDGNELGFLNPTPWSELVKTLVSMYIMAGGDV